jgi:hypothetical protein
MEHNMNGMVTNIHTILLRELGGNHLKDLDVDGRIYILKTKLNSMV